MDGTLIFTATLAVGAVGAAFWQRGKLKSEQLYHAATRRKLDTAITERDEARAARDAAREIGAEHRKTIETQNATIERLTPDAEYGRDQRAKQKAASEAGVKARLAKQTAAKADAAARAAAPAPKPKPVASKRPPARGKAKK